MLRRLPLLLLAYSLTLASLLAQHGYTPADVEDGGRLFRANCANCHGPDGNFIPGIDLGRNRFKTASTDSDLVRVIRIGVPGTAMPPNNYSEFQATTIVAYLRSMAADEARAGALGGDPSRGKAWYEKSDCATCHRVKGVGSRQGPDLTEIGAIRRAGELERSLLEPDAEVLQASRLLQIAAKDGITITGIMLNQDAFSVQILDTKDQLRSIPRDTIRDQSFVTKSPMPSYRDKLNAQELADLVSYLASLKGAAAP